MQDTAGNFQYKPERRKIMKKAAKIRLIILCSILGLILLLFAFLGGLYIYSEQVIFDHIDNTHVPYPSGLDISEDDYPVKYPWFGNPLMIYEGGGGIYVTIFEHGGEKNISVYNAVNDPLVLWVDFYLSNRYDRRFTLDYTLEQDNRTISVHLFGTAYDDDGSAVPLDQSFLFDIEDASPDKLPTWLNEDDMSDEYKEFVNYLFNHETAPVPDWVAEKYGDE